MPEYYAHTLDGKPRSEWELLSIHSGEVRDLAAEFASAFDARAWGELAGQWHDLGKLQPDFQHYIRGETKSGPPHAWLGAAMAALEYGTAALPLISAIAAHHGALANFKPDEANGSPAESALLTSLQRWRVDIERFRPLLPAAAPLPPKPEQLNTADGARVELFTRFLFSVLIDADRTATARFYARHIPALTSADLDYDSLFTLAERLDVAIDAMPPKGSPAVIALRRQVLAACRDAARLPRGRFSLTVPTGGGKTLSAMSFALNHAKRHGLRAWIETHQQYGKQRSVWSPASRGRG